jgi:enoyl-CoA hydratase
MDHLAEAIARNGPCAVASTKAAARQSVDLSFAAAWELQKPFEERVFASEDARALAEKRAPAWRGR